jgi:hypothetical protein
MEQLPRGLVCITLEHVIDDVDAVEALLAQDQKYENCIPLALKDVFHLQRIPDARLTLIMLRILWPTDMPRYDRLYLAAGEGLTSLVAHILEGSSELQEDTHTVSVALDEAAGGRHNDTIKLILSYIPERYRQGSLDYALRAAANASIHECSRCPNNFDTVKLLFDMKANANNYMALAAAASCGNIPLAELLLERKANVNNYKRHVLWEAIENGQIEMLKLLMHHGISADTITSVANEVIEREIAGSEEEDEPINREILRNADKAKALVSR